MLAVHFARDAARRYGWGQAPRFSGAARRRLEKQAWPGNARELRNVVTRAVLLSAGSLIQEEHLSFNPYLAWPSETGAALTGVLASRPSPTRLKELLHSEGGNVSALSRRLQVCSKTIYRWLKSYHIDLIDIRAAEMV